MRFKRFTQYTVDKNGECSDGLKMYSSFGVEVGVRGGFLWK